MDYDIQRCTRHCAASGRELREGEWFYSVLVDREGVVTRLDYALDAWQGPPAEALASWKSRIATREHRRARMAPSDVLLQLLEDLEHKPEQADLRYVLALLLVRRRVVRVEETADEDPQAGQTLTLHCPRNEQTYRVPVPAMAAHRLEAIQQELARLLFAEPAPGATPDVALTDRADGERSTP